MGGYIENLKKESGPDNEGLVGYEKEFRLYSKCSGKSLEDSTHGNTGTCLHFNDKKHLTMTWEKTL